MATIKTITLRLEEDMHKELKLKAFEAGTPMNKYLLKLIADDLKKEADISYAKS